MRRWKFSESQNVGILERRREGRARRVRKLGPRDYAALTVIKLEQPAKFSRRRTGLCLSTLSWGDELVAETLVRPFLVIMMHKRAHRSAKVPFAEWHDAVQAFGLTGKTNPRQTHSDLDFAKARAVASRNCSERRRKAAV